ncbi:MAG: hypothetical protein J5964_08460, partial [Eubacterium sp.]|nr:hypothetical protein [Eubacterium sp.]
MLILTAKEIRAVENKAFSGGFTEEELMKSAGTACFRKMLKYYEVEGKTVAVVCGNGKNAGDGFVIAKLLKEVGANAHIVLADKAPE